MQYNKTMLGKSVAAPVTYNPDILQPLERKQCRNSNINKNLNMIQSGFDDWTSYELSWCNEFGCPKSNIITFSIPSNSKFLIESKSFKLYLNSFNFSRIKNINKLQSIIEKDLSEALQSNLIVKIHDLSSWIKHALPKDSICIDSSIQAYTETNDINNSVLKVASRQTQETIFTNNFRSNCPVTGQPDWATIIINYQGRQIIHSDLYLYLLSYRKHNGFHEQCIEQIFIDIMLKCKPQELEVRGYFTRRGGLDINPVRSTKVLTKSPMLNMQPRQ